MVNPIHPIAPITHMSPENTHKLMGFYTEGLILGVNTMYMLFCFFKVLVPHVCMRNCACALLCSQPHKVNE